MAIIRTQSALSFLGHSALLAVACLAQSTSPGLGQSARDRTLIGLVKKGHSIDAICEFLGLLQVDLLARVCALNLSTPHNGSVRRRGSSKTTWQLGEIRELIELWERNLSTSLISLRLNRSPGAIWRKKRWLGLDVRVRRDIITQMPQSLVINQSVAVLPVETVRTRIRWDEATYRALIDRFLSYQHYKGIARDLNLTPAQVRSKIKVVGLPSDRDRRLQTMEYVPETTHAIALRAKYIQRVCAELGQIYVTLRKGFQQYCPAYYHTEQYKHRANYGSDNCSVAHLC